MGAGLEQKDTARKSSIRDDWIGKPRSIFIRNPLVSIPCPYRVPTIHLELGKSRFLIAFRWQIFYPKIWFRSFTFWTVTFLWDEIRIFRCAGWIRLRILHRLSRTDFYSEMIPSLGEPKRLAIPPSGFALSNRLQLLHSEYFGIRLRWDRVSILRDLYFFRFWGLVPVITFWNFAAL